MHNVCMILRIVWMTVMTVPRPGTGAVRGSRRALWPSGLVLDAIFLGSNVGSPRVVDGIPLQRMGLQ